MIRPPRPWVDVLEPPAQPLSTDRQFEEDLDVCRCEIPLPATQYLGEQPCVRCQKAIPSSPPARRHQP